MILGLFLTATASAQNCEKMELRYIYNKKEVLEKTEVCQFKEKEVSYFSSKSCMTKKCDLLTEKSEKIKVLNLYTQIGSPGFNLCRHLGGFGQIIKLKNKKETLETERCLKGKDFVEISLLIDTYKQYF